MTHKLAEHQNQGPKRKTPVWLHPPIPTQNILILNNKIHRIKGKKRISVNFCVQISLLEIEARV